MWGEKGVPGIAGPRVSKSHFSCIPQRAIDSTNTNSLYPFKGIMSLNYF